MFPQGPTPSVPAAVSRCPCRVVEGSSETAKVNRPHSWQYFLRVSELEGWVEEKLPLVRSQDFGRDEAATFRLIRKHQVPWPHTVGVRGQGEERAWACHILEACIPHLPAPWALASLSSHFLSSPACSAPSRSPTPASPMPSTFPPPRL